MRTAVEIDSSSIFCVSRFRFVKSAHTHTHAFTLTTTHTNHTNALTTSYNQSTKHEQGHISLIHLTARRNFAPYRSSSSASASVRRPTTRFDGFPSHFAFQLFVLAPLPTFLGVSKWLGRMITHGRYVWVENGYLIFPAKYSKYKHTQKTFMQYRRFMHKKCLQFVCPICATSKAPPFNFNQHNLLHQQRVPADIQISTRTANDTIQNLSPHELNTLTFTSLIWQNRR